MSAIYTFLKRPGSFLLVVLWGLGLVAALPARAEVDFKEIIKSVVMVQSHIPQTARTVRTLGTKRQGSGIVIDDQGLVLTIGYLIMESEKVTLINASGDTVPAAFVAYDHVTGFGLVRAVTPIGVAPLVLGVSSEMTEKTVGLAVSLGDSSPVTPVQVVSRRAFAGTWEYLLDSALFTMPPHRGFGGAALLNEQGQLVGVGSLFVNDAMGNEVVSPGNLFVPVDILKPILSDLIANGRRSRAPGPWLGIYTNARAGRVFVTRVAEAGPADKAGIKSGDVVMGVGGKRVSTMIEFYERVRSSGAAGAEVTIDLLPYGGNALEIKQIVVRSQDRHDWLSKPQSH